MKALAPEKTIPDKHYFRIGEVGRIGGVPTYVLRFWESEFPQIRPRRTPSGQRLYRRKDVELILTIRHLLYEKKFTIEGARQHLRQHRFPGASSAPGTRRKNADTVTLEEIRRELAHIRNLLS